MRSLQHEIVIRHLTGTALAGIPSVSTAVNIKRTARLLPAARAREIWQAFMNQALAEVLVGPPELTTPGATVDRRSSFLNMPELTFTKA